MLTNLDKWLYLLDKTNTVHNRFNRNKYKNKVFIIYWEIFFDFLLSNNRAGCI